MSKDAHKLSNKSRTLVLERWGLWKYKKLKGKAERSLKCWPAGLVQSRKKVAFLLRSQTFRIRLLGIVRCDVLQVNESLQAR